MAVGGIHQRLQERHRVSHRQQQPWHTCTERIDDVMWHSPWNVDAWMQYKSMRHSTSPHISQGCHRVSLIAYKLSAVCAFDPLCRWEAISTATGPVQVVWCICCGLVVTTWHPLCTQTLLARPARTRAVLAARTSMQTMQPPALAAAWSSRLHVGTSKVRSEAGGTGLLSATHAACMQVPMASLDNQWLMP
jgi:hypothetical protein